MTISRQLQEQLLQAIDHVVAAFTPGIQQTLKTNNTYPADVLGNDADISNLLKEVLSATPAEIKADGTYIWSSFNIESAREFVGFVNQITAIAKAHPTKKLSLQIPILCNGNHWCLASVELQNGKVTTVNVWDPFKTTNVSTVAFNSLASLKFKLLSEITQIEKELVKLSYQCLVVAPDSEAEKKLLAGISELNEVLADKNAAAVVFENTTYTHTAGGVQVNDFSCAENVVQEALKRAFSRRAKEVEDTLKNTSPLLAALRDADADTLDERAIVMRKAVVDVLVANDKDLQQEKTATEKELLTKLVGRINRKLSSTMSAAEIAAIIDAELASKEFVAALKSNKILLEDFDQRLAGQVQALYAQHQGKLTSKKELELFNQAKRDLVVERINFYGIKSNITLFKPVALNVLSDTKLNLEYQAKLTRAIPVKS